MWKKLTIKTKSIIAVSVIVIATSLMLGVYFLTLYSLQEQNEKINNINALNQSFLLRQIQHLQWVNSLSNYIINPDPDTKLSVARDPALCGLGKWYYSGERKKVEAAFPDLADELAALEQPHKELHATAGIIEKLKAENNLAEMRNIFSTQTLDSLRKVEENLVIMQNNLGEAAQKQVEETERSISSAINITAAIGVVGALAVLLLVLIMATAILRPIAALVTYASKCRAGEEAEIPFSGSDELGTLAGILGDLMQNLGEQLSFSQGVLEGLSVPCSIFSSEDKTVFTNKYMMALIERDGKPSDFYGMTSGGYIWGDQDKSTLSTRALKENKSLSVQMEFKTHKGKSRHAAVSSAPFYNKRGDILGTVSVWMDMTDTVSKQLVIEENSRRIQEIAASATDVAHSVSSASAEISVQVEQSSGSAEEQKGRVEQTATAMNQMSATALEVAQSASRASDTAVEARKNAREGADALEKVRVAVSAVESRTGAVKEGMDSLSSQVMGISAILNVISDIADQTNLLALNAAIEAARAGEAGRGFAVVADEVRKLAEKTMQATGEVTSVIGAIQSGSKASSDNVENAAAAVVEVKTFVADASGAIEAIVTQVEHTAEQIQSIATAAEEQTAVTEEINVSLGDINRLSTETSESMVESAKAVEELARQAETLSGLISRLQEGGSEEAA